MLVIFAVIGSVLNSAMKGKPNKGTPRYVRPANINEGIELNNQVYPITSIDSTISDSFQNGSLNYTSTEGAAISGEASAPIYANNEGKLLQNESAWDISNADLQGSVIMSEILGPPRAFKRKIR